MKAPISMLELRGGSVKGISVYERIQESKRLGYSKQKTAERLQCCWRTVDKYWDMTFDDYQGIESKVRKESVLEQYDAHVIAWLTRYPDMSSAQVFDWLLKRFDDIGCSERTVRRHVAALREGRHIPKCESKRDYEATPDPPKGRQMQVDFGESWMEDIHGRRIHVRFAGFVLSWSRYRYAFFQSRPFTSHDLIEAIRKCFAYMGGRTEEIVFDQDSVVSVAENAGDILLTREMTLFKAECGFEVYLCRGADPETKGRIERTVGFVKGNFIKHRMYPGDDDALNEEILAWLDLTGNAKPNGTTKEAPVSRFAVEQALLIECETAIPKIKLDTRSVRKDNTIIYLQNRYSLPLGTKNAMDEVKIDDADGTLHVYTMGDEPICQHVTSDATGRLIQKSAHRHDRTTKVLRLRTKLLELLGDDAESFIDSMVKEHPRYECDQLALLQHAYGEYGRDTVIDAVRHCSSIDSYSANDVIDWAQANPSNRIDTKNQLQDLQERYPLIIAKRNVSDYAGVI